MPMLVVTMRFCPAIRNGSLRQLTSFSATMMAPRILKLGEDEDEFVAAHAGDGVGLAELSADPLGKAPENTVAGVVAIRVLNLFEVIHIQRKQCQWLARSRGQGDGLLEPILEKHAVGKSGERVVSNQMRELRVVAWWSIQMRPRSAAVWRT